MNLLSKTNQPAFVQCDLPRFSSPQGEIFSLAEFHKSPVWLPAKAEIVKGLVGKIASGQTVYLKPPKDSELQLIVLAKRGATIAVSTQPSSEKVIEFTLVFFPRPEDAGIYYMAGRHSRWGGPADTYPGSVGTLGFKVDLKEGVGTLLHLQSSVKYSLDRVWNQLKKSENGNLSERYSNWQSGLLRVAVNYFQRCGISDFRVKSADCPSASITEKPIKIDLITKLFPNLNKELICLGPNEDNEFEHWHQFKLGSLKEPIQDLTRQD